MAVRVRRALVGSHLLDILARKVWMLEYEIWVKSR
jgi:hypothetical protein